MPADGLGIRATSAGLTLPECRSGSSRCSRGPAAPGSPAGRRRRRAGASRTNGAARAGDTPPCERSWRAQTRSRRRTSEVRQPAAGLREEQRAARRRLATERAGARARGSGRASASPARRPARPASWSPCPRRAPPRRRSRSRCDVEVDELLGPQAAGVGELEQRAVAQVQRRRGRDPVEQRRDLVRLEGPAAASGARLGAGISSAGFCSTRPCSRRTRKNARSAASLRATVAATVAAIRERRRVAAHGPRGDRRPGSRPCASHQARTGRRRLRRHAACARRRRGG